MSKINRNWNKLPISQRIAFMRQAVNKQKATPSPIPHPYPDLAALDTLIATAEADDATVAALETQLASARASRSADTDAAMAEFDLDAKFVEADTKGDASQEIAAGFAVSGAPSPVGPMTQPLDLTVSAGDNEGSLDWQSHPVAGSIGMEVATTATPNDNASWVSRGTVSQSSGTITGLTSGVRTYVRIRAIGPAGPGPWSDLAGKMVP